MAALKILSVFALMLNLTFSTVVHAQGCPQDWAQYGSSCYHLGKDRKTWNWADSYCRSLDSLLAVVDSADEQDFITDTFTMQRGPVWLGCKEKTEGEWICRAEGGTTKPMEFTNWDPGHRNTRGLLGCVMLNFSSLKWFNYSGTSNFYEAHCERRVVATNTVDNKNACPQFCHSHKYCTQN